MNLPSVGVNLGDLRLGARDSLARASDMRFDTIEIPAAAGELSPRELSDSGRRHLSRMVSGMGLAVASLAADMHGQRLTDAATVDQRIARTLEILELARDLGVPVVTSAVGALTHPETGDPSPVAIEALRAIGDRADMLGRIIAIRPSYDTPERLEKVLAALDCPALRVGLDPAGMAMVGVNPLPIVERFADRLALVHARDATTGSPRGAGRETLIGEGDIDFERLYDLLDAADYHGAHIIRRLESHQPFADLVAARAKVLELLRDRA
jgi:sugar phosphate isomerase/epimerase